MTTSRTATDAEFTAFVADAGPRLHRTARLLSGDAHRADDLVQATLVKTYLAWPRAVATDPEAYARRVLANQRIDTWRKGRREVLTDPVDVPDVPAASSADDAADRDEVVRALMTLTPRQRRIVVLRHLVGLTDAEVAADLGISIGTVKSTSSRALAQLRDVLVPGRTDEDVADRLGTVGADTAQPSSAARVIARAASVQRRRRGVVAAAAAALIVAGVVLLPGAVRRVMVSGGHAAADWPVYSTLTELTAASDVVVEGAVLDARREEIDWDLGPVVDLQTFEVYRVEVAESFVGPGAAGDVIEVAAWIPDGGSPDADVRLDPGATYVLFLGESFDGRPRHMLNPFQAVYRVADDGTFAPVSTDPAAALAFTRAELEALQP